MPILNPATTPNRYYAQSSFLFWAIIGVSCRGHPEYSSLLDNLIPHVNEIALKSPKAEMKSLYTVKALLLLLTWHPSQRSLSMDITFPLSGSLLHIAMQLGLHMPVSSQDASTYNKIKLTEIEVNGRAELWAYCIVAYQRFVDIG